MAEEKKDLEKQAAEDLPEVEDLAETEEKSAEEEKAEAREEKKKSSDKKILGKRKDKALEKLEEKLAELEDKRVRQLAEFENFRKRSEKEKSQMFEIGAKSVVEKMLPVIDNFERGLQAVPEEEKETPFVQGVELVYKQLLTAFEELGVKPIEAVGKEFDPNFHNAVMHVEDENFGENVVSMELQKGYRYRDSVVRHSMVQVAN